MTLEYSEHLNTEKWRDAVDKIAKVLSMHPEDVRNYLVIVYDGTDTLKADTDLDDIEVIISFTISFLENLAGKKVMLI